MGSSVEEVIRQAANPAVGLTDVAKDFHQGSVHNTFHRVLLLFISACNLDGLGFLGSLNHSTTAPVGLALLSSDLILRQAADGPSSDIVVLAIPNPRGVDSAVEYVGEVGPPCIAGWKGLQVAWLRRWQEARNFRVG